MYIYSSISRFGAALLRVTVGVIFVWAGLDKLYTREIRNANLLLWMVADGLSTPYERFIWVKEWFEKQK